MYHRSNKYVQDNKKDLICQILDWKTNKDIVNINNQSNSENSESENYDELYELHLFGITELNKSVHITVTD